MHTNEWLGAQYLDTQLLMELTLQPFKTRFVRRQLTARKLPKAAVINIRGPTRDQHLLLIGADHCSRRNMNPSFYHYTHYVFIHLVRAAPRWATLSRCARALARLRLCRNTLS